MPPLVATNIDARKKFQWALLIPSKFGPVNIAQIVECDSPKVDLDKPEYNSGGTRSSVKQPGRAKYNDLNGRYLMPSVPTVDPMYNWLQAASDASTGIGLRPSIVKQTVLLHHLDDAGVAIEEFKLIGCWCSGVEMEKLEGGSSDYLYETFTLTYDRFERRPL